MTIPLYGVVTWARSSKILLGLGLTMAGVEAIAASESHALNGSETHDEEIIVVADDAGGFHRVKPTQDGQAVFEKLDPLAIGSKAFDLPENHNRSGGVEYHIIPGQSVKFKTSSGGWQDLKLDGHTSAIARKIEKDGAGNLYVTGQDGIANYFRLADGKIAGAFDIYLSRSVGGQVIGTAAIPDGSGMLVLNEGGNLYRVLMPPVAKNDIFYAVEKLASGIQKIESTGSKVFIFKQDGNWGFAPPDHALHGEQEFSKKFVSLNSMKSYPLRSKEFAVFSNQNPGTRKSIGEFLSSQLLRVQEAASKVISEVHNEVPSKATSEARTEVRTQVASEMEDEIRPGLKPGFMIRPGSPNEISNEAARPKATQFGVTADPNAPEFDKAEMDPLLSDIKLQVCLHIGRAPGVDRKRPWQRPRPPKKKQVATPKIAPSKLN